MTPWLPVLLALAGCKDATQDSAWTFPSLDEGPTLRGPGGPEVSFSQEELWQSCAPLFGGPEDVEHHNLLMPYRGHLVMPWAPEFGGGGLSFFEMNDPCNPVKVGDSFSRFMRETHAIGFLNLPEGDPQAGDYAVVTGNLGIQVWDISDPTAPFELAYLILDGVFYPDSYARVVLSVAWQHPWLYVGGADNGVYVVDTSDLANPVAVGQYTFDPVLRVGGVFALGNKLMVSPAEGNQATTLDISIPQEPQPIPGAMFPVAEAGGQAVETYHGNIAGPYFMFARKEGAGGALIYDVSDPSQPTFVGDGSTEGGNGGYVFYDQGYAFVGDSHWGVVLDLSDPTAPTELGRATLPGDQDTFVPYGNVAILSVDEDAEDDVASVVVPWTTEPDRLPPELLRVDPSDGEQGVAVSARVGLGFDEPLEPATVFMGSIRMFDEGGAPVPGWTTTQENVASYIPMEPLAPGTRYTVEVLAGGVGDVNDNRLAEDQVFSFTTAGNQ